MSRQRSSAKRKLESRQGASCSEVGRWFSSAANKSRRGSFPSAVKDPSFVLVWRVASVGVKDGSENVLHGPNAQISTSRSGNHTVSFHGIQKVFIVERSDNVFSGTPRRSWLSVMVLGSPGCGQARNRSNAVLSIQRS
jgi:hypothetical protein